MNREKIKFREWIDEMGVGRVMTLLKVSEGTVRNWRSGRYLPRAEQMAKIKKISGGRVSVDEMVATHLIARAN